MNNKINQETKLCIICGSEVNIIGDERLKVEYAHCEKCGFIHKLKIHHVDKDEEVRIYSKHDNSFESKGYVKMFTDLIRDFIKPLNITGKGLEFGSGPGPVLLELLKRLGIDMCHYDPFYHNEPEYLEHKYELITTTEVVEHFFNPMKEFKHLSSLLDEGGYLVIMTSFRTMPIEDFTNWWYRRDATHVSFYTEDTLNYIAEKYNLKVINTNKKNIIVMYKEKTSA